MNHSFFIILYRAYGMTQAMPADNTGSPALFFFLINIKTTRGFLLMGLQAMPITIKKNGKGRNLNDEDNEEKDMLAAVSEKFSRHIGKERDMTV